MSLFGITAKRADVDGKISELMVGRVDGATNKFLSQPAPMNVSTLADLVKCGEQAWPLFPGPLGGYVLGPKVLAVTNADGTETIDLTGAPEEGRKLADLPAF